MKRHKIILVVHDVRSAHNVGSLLRTADGIGVDKIYFSGYTPYPEAADDARLPHVRSRATKQIHKTALGAENNLDWSPAPDIFDLLDKLKDQKFLIAALEQAGQSQALQDYHLNQDIALIVGNEVDGLEPKILGRADICLEIPMVGKKESYNVSVAAAIALYHLRYLA